MKKTLLLFSILAIIYPCRGATTLGSEISYRSIASKKFEVTLKIYRNCTSIPLGNPGSFNIVCASGGTIRGISYSKTAIRDVSPRCKNGSIPCSPQNSTVSTYGVEEHTYVGIVDFNVSPLSLDLLNGCCEFRIFYDECCRNGSITTGTAGNSYVDAIMNVCLAPENSSPLSSNAPIARVCCNQYFYYSAGTKDTLDSDSLSFHLVAAKESVSSNFSYGGSYSATRPLSTYTTGSGTINMYAVPPIGFGIDSITGMMAFTPTGCSEIGPVVVQTNEYRKDSGGVYRKIGETRRDIMFIVNNCSPNFPPLLSAPYANTACAGRQICLSITASDPIYAVPPPATSPPADTVNLTVDYLIPGASFVIQDTNSRNKTGSYCWTPDTTHIRNLPYTFTATATETRCSPSPASSSRTYSIRVFPNFSSGRNITKLSCGKYILSASGSSPDLTYNWQIKDSTGSAVSVKMANKSSSNKAQDTIQFLQSGKYIFVLVANNAANCPQYFYDTIRTDNMLAVSLVSDTTVCRELPATLSPDIKFGLAPYKYKWTSSSDQSGNDSASVFTFNPKGSNTIELIVTDAGKCSAKASSVVKISGDFSLGQDTQICRYDTFLLKGPDNIKTYQWFPSLTSGKDISIINAGTYILRTEDSMSCINRDTIQVTESGTYELGRDTTTCSGETVFVEGPTGWFSYMWSNGKTDKDQIISDSGKHVLTVYDKYGCYFKDSMYLHNYPRPEKPFSGGKRIICKGGNITLDAGGGHTWYSWNTGQTAQMITVDKKGKYIVSITNDFGCGIKDSVTTEIDSMTPFAWFSYAKAQRLFEFVPSLIGAYDYTWDFGDGNTSKALQTSHYFQTPGVYKVCLRIANNNGCSDTICSSVQAYSNGPEFSQHNQVLVYPNPFTNELSFEFSLDATADLEISIFDLLGKELYSGGNEKVAPGKFVRTIDTDQLFLPAGYYQARVRIGSSEYFIKLVHLN